MGRGEGGFLGISLKKWGWVLPSGPKGWRPVLLSGLTFGAGPCSKPRPRGGGRLHPPSPKQGPATVSTWGFSRACPHRAQAQWFGMCILQLGSWEHFFMFFMFLVQIDARTSLNNSAPVGGGGGADPPSPARPPPWAFRPTKNFLRRLRRGSI